jgi:hypothetical protein
MSNKTAAMLDDEQGAGYRSAAMLGDETT